MKKTAKLEIVERDGGFAVQDKNGVVFGPEVKTREEAEELLKDWEAYYTE